MSYGFKIVIEGKYACFTRPEFKVERVSYDVPTPGAIEGILKSIYWKPAIKYVVDKIIVFNPIKFETIRRNEVKEKVKFSAMKSLANGENKDEDPCIYTSEERKQRTAVVLKDVSYGIEFHFELTGLKSEGEGNSEAKHASIIERRLKNGQYFRTPCMGCSEFPIYRTRLVEEFDVDICEENLQREDVDLGFMCYRMEFQDKGVPVNGDWEHPVFSDKANATYYRPHMRRGVIDVNAYREVILC